MKEENREYVRFSCLLPGEARLKSKAVKRATIKDFSREGLRLVLHDYRIHPGSSMEVRLDIPGRNDPAYVSGKIMWSQCCDNDREIGIKINFIDNISKCEILDYVYNTWRTRVRYKKTSPKSLWKGWYSSSQS